VARLNLGKDVRTKQEVSISQGDRLRGLYCLGATGTGKTTFLVNLILQDIKAGRGLCFLDPHGDAIKDVLTRLPSSRENDVILLNPRNTAMPFGLNLFFCPDSSSDEQVALTSGLVMHIFERVWGVGNETPRLAQFLRNITITCIENDVTMAEIPLLLQDSSFRSQVVRNVQNEQVRLFWQAYNNLKPTEQLDRADSTLNKVDAFLTQPMIANIVSQTHTTIDFRAIMDEGKILLVELDPRLEDISTLLGTAIIGKILEAAYSRKDSPQTERRLFSLVVDECQRYETEDFVTLLAEARKFGIATTIAHQIRGQLSERMKSATLNASNFIIFKIASEDTEIAGIFDTTPEIEVVGREEVLVPRKSVVTHLMISGHESSKVMAFTRKYIIPLNLATKEKPIEFEYIDGFLMAYPMSPIGGANNFIPEDIEKGLVYLNEYLYVCMTHGSYTEREELIEKVERLFRKYLGYELEKFHNHLTSVAFELELNPIKEGSGKYVDVKRRVQTHSDRQNGIVNALTHLERFTAWVKLGNNEQVISTLPLPPRGNVRLSEMINTINHRNVEYGYLRPVSEVKAEIRGRHDGLVPRLTSKQRV
jgi:hypothetical protein